MNVVKSVRPARPSDALAIAQVQREAMLEAISAGLDHRAGPMVGAQLEIGSLAAAWQATIEDLPSDRHHVLVAVAGDEVEGFAAVAPSPAVILKGDDESGRDAESGRPRVAYEITNFSVPLRMASAGHDARLLAAITDICTDATELHTWAIAGHDQFTHFLDASGFAPRPLRRHAEVDGEEIREHLWWTTLERDAD
ncbi:MULTISPECIES: hypothetical protein [Trueperella]|uniref:N-acetyltransferase domain-containing protein n=1 Tax=Trueperella bernardiae TaxID=59561 RepID=A0AAW6ZI35_9ACTO|nr:MULTISPECIES: hypothetical protein [Trueperella]MCM3907302.1 hypothetical protein [Trueperella bernardiae]MDK8601271.1 hypothetical protein [Trueperella bernardiae]MDV6238160.1 hypothetical protein [Trueperella bernardiae]OFS75786.1 hypothetical protein HMPREF3167_02935 [Trueperella sp. HMSC08B05]PKZ89775.1 hypothetical protein CYK24_00905 [Trueperella bernardiae]